MEKEIGLYRKFDVRRTDGSSSPGGKHERCNYFVLDITHDKFASAALSAYADACADEFPILAQDLRDAVKCGRPHVVFAEAINTRHPVQSGDEELRREIESSALKGEALRLLYEACMEADAEGELSERVTGPILDIAREALTNTKEEGGEEVDPMFVCDKHGVGDFPCQQCKQEELTKAEERGYERGLEEAAKVAENTLHHFSGYKIIGCHEIAAAIRALKTGDKP